MGTAIVIAILAVAVFFAVRSLIRSHKSGGCCGDCCKCGGSCATTAKKK